MKSNSAIKTAHGNLIKTFIYEEGTTEVYDTGIIKNTIEENAYIDVPFLENGRRDLESLKVRDKFFVLSTSKGFYRISKEAKILSASKDYAERLGAVAVVINHIAIKFVLDFYLKINKPFVPTKGFTDEESALKWLSEQMQ